jgi:dTDP-4-dehydrorhamnose 3,5-epimerase
VPSTLQNQTFERIETSLPGVCVIQPRVFGDSRGFFLESYSEEKFHALGITHTFIQDNHSCSAKNVLRGIHFQSHRPQAKLCRVVVGEVLDVAVDIRVGSPNFGKWVSVILSEKSRNEIFIPAGFGHGFLALSEIVHFLYKVNEPYDAPTDRGILWNDPRLGVDWGISQPVLSPRDAQFPTLDKMPLEMLPKYTGE